VIVSRMLGRKRMVVHYCDVSGRLPIRFGVYELHPETGELLKNGSRIRLQEQPLKVLCALVDRAGELVSRDELKQQLAPESAFGDFDHALNVAVAKLRRALHDSAEKPLYIETFHKRGYRFVAPVVRSSNTAPSVPSFRDQVPTPQVAERQVSWQRKNWARVAVPLAIIVLLAAWLSRIDRPLGRGRLKPFTSYVGTVGDPVISPDGTRIAFLWDDETSRALYVQAVGTEKPVKLVDMPSGETLSYDWSPDGTQLVLLRSGSPERRGLYFVPSLGGGEKKLMSLEHVAYRFGVPISGRRTVAWSPEGKFIALTTREAENVPYSLYLLSLDSMQLQRMSSPPADHLGDIQPVYSPDGKWLAFVRVHDTVTTDIFVMPVTGGSPRRVTHDDAPIGGVAFTPDSRHIVFNSGREGLSNLYSVATRGGTPQLLLATGELLVAPTVSRARTRIAFSHSRPDGNVWKYAISRGNGASEPVKIIASSRQQTNVSFSPDGSRIAFNSDRTGFWEVFVSDANGANVVQLTSMKNASSPSWSPDGGQIAFDNHRGKNGQIFTISSDGGVPQAITDGKTNDTFPTWSRDGSSIYFNSTRTGRSELWKIRLADRSVTQITRQGLDFGGIETPEGDALLIHRGDSLLRVSLDGSTEQLLLKRSRLCERRGIEIIGRHIYYVDCLNLKEPVIRMLNLDTGQSIEVLKPPPARSRMQFGKMLAVSPREDSLLVVSRERVASDIMILDY
jgi:Tol biopolymer transport system component/DNA-binding winged helix-turn-helix (wHTH) protein